MSSGDSAVTGEQVIFLLSENSFLARVIVGVPDVSERGNANAAAGLSILFGCISTPGIGGLGDYRQHSRVRPTEGY